MPGVLNFESAGQLNLRLLTGRELSGVMEIAEDGTLDTEK